MWTNLLDWLFCPIHGIIPAIMPMWCALSTATRTLVANLRRQR